MLKILFSSTGDSALILLLKSFQIRWYISREQQKSCHFLIMISMAIFEINLRAPPLCFEDKLQPNRWTWVWTVRPSRGHLEKFLIPDTSVVCVPALQPSCWGTALKARLLHHGEDFWYFPNKIIWNESRFQLPNLNSIVCGLVSVGEGFHAMWFICMHMSRLSPVHS